jgi:mannose-6-phosphate isomerase-like protein (cupin superfamily)
MTIRARPTIELFPMLFDGRKLGVVRTDRPGERDEWELHPDRDELLYLAQGATDVLLRDDPDDAAGERVIALTGGAACVVPRGTWHRQVVREPSVLLFLSPESVHRPHVPDDGWAPAPPPGARPDGAPAS